MCLDNAELLIKERQNEFQSVLKKLLDECPRLKIIVTSNTPMHSMSTTTEYDMHITQRLRSKQSVELFFDQIQNSIVKLMP